MTDDIVTRLRREMWYQPEFKINKFGKPNQTFELTRTNLIAADEIVRLRDERDEARHGESVAIATLQGWIEERTTLRIERDEARKMYLSNVAATEDEVITLMKVCGWDCFKEEHHER